MEEAPYQGCLKSKAGFTKQEACSIFQFVLKMFFLFFSDFHLSSLHLPIEFSCGVFVYFTGMETHENVQKHFPSVSYLTNKSSANLSFALHLVIN